MDVIEGSGSGASGTIGACLSEEEICRIIAVGMAKAIKVEILALFGLVKTALIEEFDRRYAAIL